MRDVAERVPSQVAPPARPREPEPTRQVDGHDPASVATPVGAGAPHVTGTDGLDVGEQIRRLQALAELRGAGILTDGELPALKRRVLSPGSDVLPEARPAAVTHAAVGGLPSAEPSADTGSVGPAEMLQTGTAVTGVSPAGVSATTATDKTSRVLGPVLDHRPPTGSYVTALKVVGTTPVTCRAGANKRHSYVRWKQALDAAAATAAAKARPTSCELFSLRIELRLFVAKRPGSDLDNYVKPIQDALAERGIFGPAQQGSPMKGDERVDHLEVRRKRVRSEAEAGVLAEVWTLEA